MRLPQTLCAVILLVSSIPEAVASTPDWPSTPTSPVDRAHIEALIDQLTSISSEGVGFSTMANARVFSPVDAEPQFAGGIMGTRPPSIPAPVKELVSLGIKALPELIDHIDDRRETGFVARALMGAMWYSNEFETSPNDRVPQPVGTTNSQRQIGKTEEVDHYTVTVGDICFATIGQIVNRDYSAARYQPTGCEVINSTTHTPALAAAVRAEWAGLTDDEFKDSLIADAELPNSLAAGAAVKRLCYYYPKEGKRLAIRMLKRPVCDPFVAFEFVEVRLLGEPTIEDEDILDPDGIAVALAHPKTPLLERLSELGEVGINEGAPSLDSPGESREDKTEAVADRLSRLQDNADLRTSADFTTISLRPETTQLLDSPALDADYRLVNRRLLEDAFPTQLVRRAAPSNDPAVWRQALTEFVHQHGEPYHAFVWLELLTRSNETVAGGVRVETVQRAKKILNALYAKMDPNRPGFLNAADSWDRQRMIDDLQAFHDKDMDTTVLHLLRAVIPTGAQFASGAELDGDDESFGLSCVTYLDGRGYKTDCRKFLETWLAVERRDRAKRKWNDRDVDSDTRKIDLIKRRLSSLK